MIIQFYSPLALSCFHSLALLNLSLEQSAQTTNLPNNLIYFPTKSSFNFVCEAMRFTTFMWFTLHTLCNKLVIYGNEIYETIYKEPTQHGNVQVLERLLSLK